jgi:hypothetical protein
MLETLLQQYLAPLAQWVAGLFTPAEWKAFVLLIAVTLAATHTIKVIWRLAPISGPSHRQVYLVTAGIGFLVAWPIWPAGFDWWIPGVLAGPAAALAFKAGFYLIKKFAPGMAAAINADRRRREVGPPGGFERRK